MAKPHTVTNSSLRALGTFLDANAAIDPSELDLFDERTLAGFAWPEVEVSRDQLVESLRAYQRLLRVVPRANRTLLFALLERGIGSAVHIAAIPRARFLSELSQPFGGDTAWMSEVHDAALARRSALLLRYVQTRQNLELRARPISARGVKD